MKNKLKIFVGIMLLNIFVLVGCGNDDEIVIGGKNFTEQYIMSEMLSILIEENTDLETDIVSNLAGSTIHDAILSEEIDLYLEYTGTALINIGEEPITDPDVVYNTVKEYFEEELDRKSTRLNSSHVAISY